MLHDDFAFVAFDGHGRKPLTMQIDQRLLIAVVVRWTDEFFTHATSCHRLKITTWRIHFRHLFIVVFIDETR